MTAPDTDTLAGLLAECTPGLWASEILMGSDPNGDEHPTDVEVMSEKGYFIHSHDLGYSDRVDVEILANARLIALAPELAAEVIAHRAQVAKDKARIERLEAALRPFVAYVHYAFHEGNSRFRLVEDFDEGGGWLGSEDFRRARAALEDGE